MDRLRVYGSAEEIPFYNCSGKSTDYWKSTGVSRPIYGTIAMTFGIFILIIYIPLIYVMFKLNLVRYSCYKIIVMLGIIDIIATAIVSVLSGFLFIEGAVFCTRPNLIYVAGCFSFSSWCGACASTLLLAINRVCEVMNRRLSEFLFSGKRIYISIFLVLFYIFYTTFFTSPFLFNSVNMAWITDPLTMDHKTPEAQSMYFNPIQKVQNWIFLCSTCSLYIIYCIMIKKMQHGQTSKLSRHVFIQSAVICFFNSTAALIYTAMIYVETVPWVVLIGETSWSIVHGCPAIIYLSMNKSIREEFFKMLVPGKKTTMVSASS